jgi:hypothetical protein
MPSELCMCDICRKGRELNEMGLSFMEKGFKCSEARQHATPTPAAPDAAVERVAQGPCELTHKKAMAMVDDFAGWYPQKPGAKAYLLGAIMAAIDHQPAAALASAPPVPPSERVALLDWLKSLESSARYGVRLNESDLPAIEQVRAIITTGRE